MIKKTEHLILNAEKKIPDQVRNDSNDFVRNDSNDFVRNDSKSWGFTLLELLMVIAIFGILTSVIVFNYGKFTGDTILTNMAYELALSVREAQTFGVAVRNVTGEIETANFENPYGISLDISDGNNPSYILYLDSDDNGSCDNSFGDDQCNCSGDECVQRFTMQRGMQITDLRVSISDSSCDIEEKMNINFRRPNPEPEIYGDGSGFPYTDFESVEVELSSPQDSKRYVVVTAAGQVYVTNTSIC